MKYWNLFSITIFVEFYNLQEKNTKQDIKALPF